MSRTPSKRKTPVKAPNTSATEETKKANTTAEEKSTEATAVTQPPAVDTEDKTKPTTDEDGSSVDADADNTPVVQADKSTFGESLQGTVATGDLDSDTKDGTDADSGTEDGKGEGEEGTDPVDPALNDDDAKVLPGTAATEIETQEARHARIRAEAKEKARMVPWSHVEEYLDKMNPARPNNRESILGHQSRLAQAFILLLSEEEEDSIAIESIKKLVSTIRERRKPGSVFHDSMCMRFINDLPSVGMTAVRVTEFQNILFALLELADKGNKVVLDWDVFTQRCIKGRGEIIASRLQRACNVKID